MGLQLAQPRVIVQNENLKHSELNLKENYLRPKEKLNGRQELLPQKNELMQPDIPEENKASLFLKKNEKQFSKCCKITISM